MGAEKSGAFSKLLGELGLVGEKSGKFKIGE